VEENIEAKIRMPNMVVMLSGNGSMGVVVGVVVVYIVVDDDGKLF